MSLVKGFALLAASVGLAACSADMVDNAPNDPTVQIDSFYNYGVARRDVALVVQGDAFAMPQEDFDRTVEADVQSTALPRQPTHPTLTPGPSANHNFALIFAFDPANAVTGDALCRGATKADSAPSVGNDTVHVQGAFCMEGRALTQASGHVVANSAQDPQFAHMMHEMMLALLRPDQSRPPAAIMP